MPAISVLTVVTILAKETAQWLRALVAPVEDPGLVPCTCAVAHHHHGPVTGDLVSSLDIRQVHEAQTDKHTRHSIT